MNFIRSVWQFCKVDCFLMEKILPPQEMQYQMLLRKLILNFHLGKSKNCHLLLADFFFFSLFFSQRLENKEMDDESGSTATVLFLRNDVLIVSHVGDSSVVWFLVIFVVVSLHAFIFFAVKLPDTLSNTGSISIWKRRSLDWSTQALWKKQCLYRRNQAHKSSRWMGVFSYSFFTSHIHHRCEKF